MKTRQLTVLLASMILLGACKGKNYELGSSSSADSVSIQADSTTTLQNWLRRRI